MTEELIAEPTNGAAQIRMPELASVKFGGGMLYAIRFVREERWLNLSLDIDHCWPRGTGDPYYISATLSLADGYGLYIGIDHSEIGYDMEIESIRPDPSSGSDLPLWVIELAEGHIEFRGAHACLTFIERPRPWHAPRSVGTKDGPAAFSSVPAW